MFYGSFPSGTRGSENGPPFATPALPSGHLPALDPHTAKASQPPESRSNLDRAFGCLMVPGRQLKLKTLQGEGPW